MLFVCAAPCVSRERVSNDAVVVVIAGDVDVVGLAQLCAFTMRSMHTKLCRMHATRNIYYMLSGESSLARNI